jgi:nitronate monooxygenase
MLEEVVTGEMRVFTDPVASPTGFPFKVAQLKDTVSELDVYKARHRICDLGYLREAYRAPDGTIGMRCSSEPVTTFVAKGGDIESTVGRKCVCNGLLANIGQPQIRNGKYLETGLITAGDDLEGVGRFLAPGQKSYSAADVIKKLLNT